MDVPDSANTGKTKSYDQMVGQITVGTDFQIKYEPFESFKYTPNSLNAFYPKALQKLLARK